MKSMKKAGHPKCMVFTSLVKKLCFIFRQLWLLQYMSQRIRF